MFNSITVAILMLTVVMHTLPHLPLLTPSEAETLGVPILGKGKQAAELGFEPTLNHCASLPPTILWKWLLLLHPLFISRGTQAQRD